MRHLLCAVALFTFTFGSLGAGAAIVFSDDFETPDVASNYNLSNTSRTASSDWVRANQGYGADRNGIVDEAENSGASFTDPAGEQAYTFRYTNSGVTTAQGVIGALITGNIYTVTFDVVLDGWNGGNNYSAALVTFDGAARNDVRNNTGATSTLASTSGTAGATYTPITFSYVADGTEPTLGQDVALRFFGQTSAAIIDNVVVDVESPAAIPEPASMALLGLGGVLILGGRRRRAHA